MRNKRVFLMAPLHHHYEKKGWRETQVVIRFWIITIMLVVLGSNDLKIALSKSMKRVGICRLFFMPEVRSWRK